LKTSKTLSVFFLASAFLYLGCDPGRLLDKNIDLEEKTWLVDYKPAFEFEVSDTTSMYSIFFNVRNSIDYRFTNLYITYYLLNPEGTQLSSELVNFNLFHPKTGKPYGNGLGDIFDHQLPIIKNRKFDKSGKYKLIYEQYMRTDSLTGIYAIGARVEKHMDNR